MLVVTVFSEDKKSGTHTDSGPVALSPLRIVLKEEVGIFLFQTYVPFLERFKVLSAKVVSL